VIESILIAVGSLLILALLLWFMADRVRWAAEQQLKWIEDVKGWLNERLDDPSDPLDDMPKDAFAEYVRSAMENLGGVFGMAVVVWRIDPRDFARDKDLYDSVYGPPEGE